MTSKQSQSISASGDKATICTCSKIRNLRIILLLISIPSFSYIQKHLSLSCTKPKSISANSQRLHKPVVCTGSFKGKWKLQAFTTQIILDSERDDSKADHKSSSLIRKAVHCQWLLSAPARRFRQAPHCIRCLPRLPLSPFQTYPASSKAQLSSLWWHQL